MGTAVIPYTFNGLAKYPYTQQPETPGQTQGVYISLHPDHREAILAKIIGCFAGSEEIDLVDTGVSDKVGLGFIILECVEHEIDQLLLAILRDEELVADYTIYSRDLEEV